MTNKEKIQDILEECSPIYNLKNISINTNNGILNEEYLERQKNIFIKESIAHLRDSLIKINQGYPHNDISDIQMTTEFFIIPRKKFIELAELLNNIENE